MALQLDHTIVPAYDKVKSAEFIARVFGVEYEGTWGHFAPVKVNDGFTLDFDDSDSPQSNHYAWLRMRSLMRFYSGSRKREWRLGVGLDRGRMGRSITCTEGVGFTLSVRMGMFGR